MFWANTRPWPDATTDFGLMSPVIRCVCRSTVLVAATGGRVVVVGASVVVVVSRSAVVSVPAPAAATRAGSSSRSNTNAVPAARSDQGGERRQGDLASTGIRRHGSRVPGGDRGPGSVVAVGLRSKPGVGNVVASDVPGRPHAHDPPVDPRATGLHQRHRAPPRRGGTRGRRAGGALPRLPRAVLLVAPPDPRARRRRLPRARARPARLRRVRPARADRGLRHPPPHRRPPRPPRRHRGRRRGVRRPRLGLDGRRPDGAPAPGPRPRRRRHERAAAPPRPDVARRADAPGVRRLASSTSSTSRSPAWPTPTSAPTPGRR